MKLRTIAILTAVGVLSIVGCGDDITNIIEEVVATPPPVTSPTTPVTPPTATPTPGPIGSPSVPPCSAPPSGQSAVCGDGVCHAPETCDIGGICVGGSNDLAACTSPGDCPGGRCTVVGGQPSGSGSCSANCTLETRRTGTYAAASGANVQTGAFAVPVALTGTQTIQTGAKRADDTIDINGDVTFRAGDIPMVTKAPDIKIDPAKVPGLVCACVRGIEVPAFGPGNSATGVISCGGELEDIDYVMTQDHHTDPLPLEDFVPNPECSHPADPECDDEFEIVTGVISRPCREQVDGDCNLSTENKHAGVCNSARNVEYSGSGPAGSGIIFNNTAIGLLSDRGLCDTTLGGMDPCPFPEYGTDCLPCTDDDEDKGVAENNPTTTGSARAAVFNLGNKPDFHVSEGSSTPCTDNSQCSGDVCGLAETCLADPRAPGTFACGVRCGSTPCVTTAVGRPFSCQALMDNPNGGLEGGAFAVTFPSIDAATIADNVTAVIFDFGQ